MVEGAATRSCQCSLCISDGLSQYGFPCGTDAKGIIIHSERCFGNSKMGLPEEI
jgi:hypothetical protein